MSVDKNKISAEATRLLQKGQLDKAIRAYERILAADPADTRALLKIAEIQQKKGEIPAAAETFSRVAEAYATQGFFLKSVAVYKQVLKLSPDDVRVSERLGQLYQQLGLVSEAMAQLHAIVRWAERAGDDDKLLEALRRVVEIDPENVPSSVKLGELYARLSQPKLAVEHFRRAAEQLKRNNRLDEYGKVAERIAALVPDDHVLAREVAAIFLARGDAKRALHNLQQCYRADPRQLETLTLLAKVFEELGQETKTAAVQREIARLHDEAGRRDEANAAWKRVAELEPDDAEAADALAAHSPATAPPASGAPPRPPPVPATRPDVSEAGPAGAPATAQRTGPAVAAETDPAIAKILGESDVYVKYGLHEKALEHLQKILATQPDHVEAREKASRIREQRKDIAGAADDAQRAIRAAHAQGLVDRARAGLERLRGLSPTHPEIAQLEALLAGGAPAKVEHEHEGVVLELDDLATEPLDQDAVASGEPPAEVGPDDLALSAIVPPADDQVLEGPPSADAEAILAARPDGLDDEVETVEEEEGELPAEIAAPVAEAAAPAPDRAPPPAAAPAVREPAPPPAAAPAQREPAPEPVVDEALQQDLAEADFFVSQGLLDEARAFLSELAERYPGHPAVAAKLQEVQAPGSAPAARTERAAAPKRASPARAIVPPGPAPDYLYSVRDVLEPFKKGIEQTVTADDSQTHYDLGIAYREMGLHEDAIHEFEVAFQGSHRERRIDCLTMIALCRLDAGDHTGAIEAYRAALGSEGLTDDLRRSVEYQLATAYEAAGDVDAALRSLNGLLAEDPEYRDARARVARLGGGAGRTSAAAVNPADPVAGTTASVRRSR